jgi:hypothetical protein
MELAMFAFSPWPKSELHEVAVEVLAPALDVIGAGRVTEFFDGLTSVSDQSVVLLLLSSLDGAVDLLLEKLHLTLYAPDRKGGAITEAGC